MIGVLVTLYNVLMNYLNLEKKKYLIEAGKIVEEDTQIQNGSALSKLLEKAWGFVPKEEEESLVLDHDYDGIVELDNKMPPWWLALFYGTIVFAVVYLYIYEWSGNWSSTQQWEEEVAAGNEAKSDYLAKMASLVNEENVTLLTDPDDIAMGKKTFQSLCIACHGSAGEGNSIGPNLTDEYWLHGGGIRNVFKTITHGVPEKGMIAWNNQLEPAMIQKVASYILSLQGSNPPNAKDKQGQLWTEDENIN
ncbi:hypothetical protein GCM10025777_30210 [Membranihabitans marinus]